MNDKTLLEDCETILNDWIYFYAPELCGNKRVSDTGKRVSYNGGWLAYTASIIKRLKKEQRHAKKA